MNIVLIGAKGCGKTTIGKLLAKELIFPFIDIDSVIEEIYFDRFGEKLSFREIYKKIGSDNFRQLEKDASEKISNTDWSVISTGGGSFLNPEIRYLLRKNAIVIFIYVKFDILWQRIKKDGIPAYLIDKENPESDFEKRVKYIEEVLMPFSDFIIDCSYLSNSEIITNILENLTNHFMLKMTSPNTLGEIIRVTTFGESHGKALGAVIDGLKPDISIDIDVIQKELNRRKPGQSKITTPRNEEDKVEILSGIFEGKTTGTPIAMVVYNKDQDSSKYENLKDIFRPGHADFTFFKKFGIRDHRGGGRSSGRETIGRVLSGSIAKSILENKGINIIAHTIEIHNIKATKKDYSFIEQNSVRTADREVASLMEEEILKAKKEGDSVGGIVQLEIKGVPAGIGDPIFGKLDARLSMALFSIGAVKGIEFGDGFELARMKASEANDQMDKNGFKTNRSGGILGGISTGEDIIIKIAVKPTPSISKEQMTVDIQNNERIIKIEGRHDPCIVPRIIPVVESMAALVILDALMIQEKIKQVDLL